MLTYLLFIAGFPLLIKGADLLVDGSSSIARKMRIPSIVVGLTIVAFGTSAPEFVVSFVATLQGSTDIAISNILGSNIANILLILGISSIIYPIIAKRETVLKEIPLSLLASLVVAFLANDMLIDGASHSTLTKIDGAIMLLFFAIFLYYTIEASKLKDGLLEKDTIKQYPYWKSFLFIALGLVGLVFGGKWIVDGAVTIAQAFNVSEVLIGVTIVAIGTSLPELATSAVAAYRKQTDIAIGNIVGSNIFNVFWILGFNALLKPLPFNLASNIDVVMGLIANVVLLLAMFVGRKRTIGLREGIVMLTIYIAYVIFLITNQ